MGPLTIEKEQLTMRRTYLGVLVAVMLVAGACGAQNQPTTNPATAPASPGSAPSGTTVEITVSTDMGTKLRFEPGEVAVPAGADVRLTFENRSSVPHNLTFQGPPNVATSTVVAAGASEVLEFKAPGAGDHAFVCTIHPGMGGTLVVEAG